MRMLMLLTIIVSGITGLYAQPSAKKVAGGHQPSHLNNFDPHIRNIGRLLEPTRSTVKLPNQMNCLSPLQKDGSEVYKYLHRAKLNLTLPDCPWFTHEQLVAGGHLEGNGCKVKQVLGYFAGNFINKRKLLTPKTNDAIIKKYLPDISLQS